MAPRRSEMRWIAGLAPAVLIAVAVGQIVLALTSDLSPWVGGGFGMFASTDGRAYRHLHLFALESSGTEREIFPPRELEEHVRRARSLPTETNLGELALELARRRSEPAHAIRIQVWKTRFDPRTLTPTSHLLRVLEVALPERPPR